MLTNQYLQEPSKQRITGIKRLQKWNGGKMFGRLELRSMIAVPQGGVPEPERRHRWGLGSKIVQCLDVSKTSIIDDFTDFLTFTTHRISS
jgi:hypothetical protein